MDNKFYDQQKDKNAQLAQQNAQLAKLSSIERTFVNSISALIKYMDGKTTKTEVINQLKSVGTPDALKVVEAVKRLENVTKQNKLDTSDLKAVLTEAVSELKKIPKSHAEAPEQRESVSVSNISEVNSKLDKVAERMEAAISKIKLVAEAPKVDVKVPETKAPIVNVDAPDLKPLQAALKDVVSGIKDIKIPEVPVTDLTKLEKQGEKHTKQLQELIEKPIAVAGGGGGNGTPYLSNTGDPIHPYLFPAERFDLSVAPIYYVAEAPSGTLDTEELWTVTKYDLTDLSDSSGKLAYKIAWTDHLTETYT